MRILIIKLSSLGDLFHALPAVHNLKAETGADIDWVTHQAYAGLVRCFDDISRVIAFPRQRFPQNARAFLHDLHAVRYDLVIDLQGLLKSAVTALLARGGRRIGPSFHREGSRLFYHAVAGPRNKNRHAVIENLDIIGHLGLSLRPPVFPVTFPETAFAAESPHLVICPASRWTTKTWPAANFAAVARHLQQSRRVTVTLLGAPEDEACCAGIAAALDGPCHNLAGRTPLAETGAILGRADLLLANDSGPVHMAAAVGTPALVLFGPTDPARTGPFGSGHRVVQSHCSCQPCLRRGCHRQSGPCILDIPVDDVICHAEAMLP